MVIDKIHKMSIKGVKLKSESYFSISPGILELWRKTWGGGFRPPVQIGLRILESVRAYAYLILSSQGSARSGIVGNTASALTAQSAFLNNFENVVNRKVDIREDIEHYLKTLSVTHRVKLTTAWDRIFVCFLVI